MKTIKWKIVFDIVVLVFLLSSCTKKIEEKQPAPGNLRSDEVVYFFN